MYEAAQIYVRFRNALYFMQDRSMLVVAFIVNGKENIARYKNIFLKPVCPTASKCLNI